MGSLRVAGKMAGSALGAGVEVMTGGRDRTSSWKGLELAGSQPKASPSAPFSGKGHLSPDSGHQALSKPPTVPAPPGHTFGTENCASVAGLGFAASLAVAMSGDRRARSLGQVRSGDGTGGKVGLRLGLWVAPRLLQGRPGGGGGACPLPFHLRNHRSGRKQEPSTTYGWDPGSGGPNTSLVMECVFHGGLVLSGW